MGQNTQSHRSFERLLRKLLKYPRQPAVLLLNTFPIRLME